MNLQFSNIKDHILKESPAIGGHKWIYKDLLTIFKRGKGSEKKGVLVAVERHGPVRSALIDTDKTTELLPWVERFVQKDAHHCDAVITT